MGGIMSRSDAAGRLRLMQRPPSNAVQDAAGGGFVVAVEWCPPLVRMISAPAPRPAQAASVVFVPWKHLSQQALIDARASGRSARCPRARGEPFPETVTSSSRGSRTPAARSARRPFMSARQAVAERGKDVRAEGVADQHDARGLPPPGVGVDDAGEIARLFGRALRPEVARSIVHTPPPASLAFAAARRRPVEVPPAAVARVEGWRGARARPGVRGARSAAGRRRIVLAWMPGATDSASSAAAGFRGCDLRRTYRPATSRATSVRAARPASVLAINSTEKGRAAAYLAVPSVGRPSWPHSARRSAAAGSGFDRDRLRRGSRPQPGRRPRAPSSCLRRPRQHRKW